MKRILSSTSLLSALFAVLFCPSFLMPLNAVDEQSPETVSSSDLAARYARLEAGFLLLMESGQTAKETSNNKSNDLVRTFLVESRRRNITGRLTELGNLLKTGSGADTLSLFTSLEKDFTELGALLGMSPSTLYPQNGTQQNIDEKEKTADRQSTGNNGNNKYDISNDFTSRILLRLKVVLSREIFAENRIKEFCASVKSASGHLLDEKSSAELLAVQEAATFRLFNEILTEKNFHSTLSSEAQELSKQISHDLQEQTDFLQTGLLSRELAAFFAATIVKLKSVIAFLEQEQKESDESKSESDSSKKDTAQKQEDTEKEHYRRLKMARAMQVGLLDKLRIYEKMKESGFLSSEQYRTKITELAERQEQIKNVCLP